MVKGKFKYIFKDGSSMTDRNGYKPLSGAKAWAKAYNKAQKKKSRKVALVVKK